MATAIAIAIAIAIASPLYRQGHSHRHRHHHRHTCPTWHYVRHLGSSARDLFFSRPPVSLPFGSLRVIGRVGSFGFGSVTRPSFASAVAPAFARALRLCSAFGFAVASAPASPLLARFRLHGFCLQGSL